MRIRFKYCDTVNGHPTRVWEVLGLPFPISVMTTFVKCRCGCNRGTWAMTIQFGAEQSLDGHQIATIKRALLPHVPMHQNELPQLLGSRSIGLAETFDTTVMLALRPTEKSS